MHCFRVGLLVVILSLVMSGIQMPGTTVVAMQGDNGYDCGISTSDVLMQLGASDTAASKQTYDYKELVFITGRPIVLSGTVSITRSKPSDIQTITYAYSLKDGNNSLTRTIVYECTRLISGNQISRTFRVKPNSKPRETINIEGATYKLESAQNFTMSTLTDRRPAIDYYSGNYVSRKEYSGSRGQKIQVDVTGDLWGYDQYWGSTETQALKVSVTGETVTKNIVDRWGGSGDIVISSTASKQLLYMENRPDEISFPGGYIQKQESNSLLSYRLEMPEFDFEGFATNRMTTKEDIITTSSFPQQTRLIVPDNSRVRGYWYEKDVIELTSMGIYESDTILLHTDFEQPMSRLEFAKMVIRATNMPLEPMPPIPKASKNAPAVDPSPFEDLLTSDDDFQYALTLNAKNVMIGVGESEFDPGGTLTRAQAVTIFVRTLGLESLAQSPGTATPYIDNDQIPTWARAGVLVTTYIGITKGDDSMRFNPDQTLTKAEAAAFLNRLINYMREDISKDYRDRIINY